MNLRYALSLLLSLQLAVGPTAHSREEGHDGPSFDFSDEPVIITNGDDDREGSDDGNCSGAGCGDNISGSGRDDRDGYEGPDRDENGEVDGSGHNDSGAAQVSSGFERDGSENESDSQHRQESTISRVKIRHQDHNKGFGFSVTDTNFKDYRRGDNGKSYEWNDEIVQGDGTDNTDIYFNENNIAYVKSTDEKYLLSLDGLKECAVTGSCARHGYREDWWSYSTDPSLDSLEEMADWNDLKEFSKIQLQIKTGIARAKSDTNINKSVEKIKVLTEAEFLHNEARIAYSNRMYAEAQALQEGAAQLATTIADIGLSISPLGWAKDAYELITGKNFVTGHPLTGSERIFAGIGVMMPGVAGLAFAGIKIVARNPLARQGVAKAVAQTEKLSEILGDLKPARFKAGKDLKEVAIIGRDMNYVKEASNRLNAAGIKTRIFIPSPAATQNLSDFSMNYERNIIPYDKIPNTLAHKENMTWIKKADSDKVPVLDIGNPGGKTTPSRFYDDEVLEIFGGTQ